MVQELVERLERMLAVDDVAAATAAVAAAADDPVAHAIGRAALAAHAKDAAAARAHAEEAHALAPGEPAADHALAVAALMRGDRDAAERHAGDAVAHGGGVRSLGWLANLQLGAGKAAEAEATYRRMLDAAPTSVQALSGVAACRYKQQDLDGAVGWLARAYEQDPTDPAPIRSLMNMFGEAGRVLGAIALGNLTRDRHAAEARLAIDLMLLHLNQVLMGGFPPPHVVPDADHAVTAVVRSAAGRSARVRLGVARALVDCQRTEDARRVLGELDGQALDASERGNFEYVRGLIAERAGNSQGALAAYEAAVLADPKRWDACCNAMTILLDRGDPDALARAQGLLGRVPPEVKASAPQLMFNEAVFLHRAGRRDEANAAVHRVLAATRGEGELAALARELLTEVRHGE